MTVVIMIMSVLVAGLLQAILPMFAGLGQCQFPLLLAVVLYYAVNRDSSTMLLAALLAGVMQDAMGPTHLGYSAFCFGLAGWIVGRSRGLVMTESILTEICFGALASGLVILGMYFLLARDAGVVCSFGRLLLKMMGATLLGAFSAPFVFGAVGMMDRMVGNVEDKEGLDVLE